MTTLTILPAGITNEAARGNTVMADIKAAGDAIMSK